ncbi:MAG: aspartate/glutamate racemase family protein [Candidatus Bathyarchaeota archaeon]|nr:aspartate/glutamate racemase family protein [Candidatus Bathyarchaeota archaeon]
MQRLGVILPSSNTTVEAEFSSVLHGSDITVHYARIPLREVTLKELETLESNLSAAAALLKDADVDAVVFACTSGSLIGGVGYDSALAKQISEAAGCPALTTSGAVVRALRKLRAHKISLATPYIGEVTEREVSFLKENGFTTAKVCSLEIKDNLTIGRLTAKDASILAADVDTPASDAVFISCTNFCTFKTIASLDRQLAKPVVSSNSATLWAALRVIKAEEHLSLGRLYDL